MSLREMLSDKSGQQKQMMADYEVGIEILDRNGHRVASVTARDVRPDLPLLERPAAAKAAGFDAVEFCAVWQKLARLPKTIAARLPSEAEWEYACRAGTLGAYYLPIERSGWIGEETDTGGTHPVGEKEPNAWGLFDMHGNLWEWTADGWYDYTEEERTDPRGTAEGEVRVDRGGCWDSQPDEARSAHRGTYEAERSSRFVGFRFILSELP